jgi:hypothetical protein
MEQELDFDVVVGLDVGKAAHHAVALDQKGGGWTTGRSQTTRRT